MSPGSRRFTTRTGGAQQAESELPAIDMVNKLGGGGLGGLLGG